MDRKINILILEHNPIDTNLLKAELDHSFSNYLAHIVQTKKDYEDALISFTPDVILSDYSLPAFDWNDAFQLKQKLIPDTPFILISGAIGELAAVELIKNGVTDYVPRDKPGTLAPKITRALNEVAISTRKKAEEETLQKSILNLRTIFENTDVGFLFLNMDYKVVAFNHISSHWAANIFGGELKEDVSFVDLILPHLVPDFIAFGLSVLNGNASTYEASYPKKDGELMWIVVSGKPVIADGKTMGFCIAITDITIRKLAEVQLEFDRNNLKALINNTNDLMWSVDRNLKLITSNQAFVESVKLISGKTLAKGSDMMLAGQLSRYAVYYERAFAGETFEEIEHTSVPAELWSEISFYPIRSGNEIIGTACHSHDITASRVAATKIRELNENLEQRILERTSELVEANISLETFSYSVSHDLRSPLRSIAGFANIINKEYGRQLNGEVKEFLSHIETNSKRMNTIIDDLLVLAKLGKKKLCITEVDINTLFTDVWNELAVSSPNHASLDLRRLPFVQADSSLLQQVIINLLSNAIKYSSKKEAPVVKVGFERQDDRIVFWVKDNGAGFDMSYYHRLFIAFQRLHGLSEFEGSGVGLMLVKRIIERHGGDVWAEGIVDEGACFYFSLPEPLRN